MAVHDASLRTSVSARAARQRPAALQQALLRATRVLLFPEETGLDGMPAAQARCLQEVARAEGRKMQELANDLQIKLPALSQIVDRLVRRGLMERRADPADRRVARLHLTAAARALLDEASRARSRRLEEVLERVEPDAAARLVADLTRLAEAGEALGEASPESLDGPDPIADLVARRARVRRRVSAGAEGNR